MKTSLGRKIILNGVSISLLFITIGALLSGCTSAPAPIVKIPQAVRTFKVELSTPITTSDRYSAIVAPESQTDVSFRSGGYVSTILQVRGQDGLMRTVQEGDFVKAGSTLAQVKQADYQAKVQEQSASLEETTLTDDRLRASLAQAQAAYDQSKREFERASRLFEKQALTKPELDDATAKMAINEARVQEAAAQIKINQATARRVKAGLKQSQFTALDTVLLAPLNGIILKRNIEQGTLVSSGTVAFTMADASRFKVAFGVPDVKLGEMRMGESVSVTFEAVPNRIFHGKITDVAPAADPRSRVFNVEVSLPNDDNRLKIGMVASLVTEQVEGRSLPMVPLTSVVRSSSNPNGYEVFVAETKGDKTTVQERQVKVGDAQGQMITVLEGLAEGDEVVTDGSTRVASGQEVRVLN